MDVALFTNFSCSFPLELETSMRKGVYTCTLMNTYTHIQRHLPWMCACNTSHDIQDPTPFPLKSWNPIEDSLWRPAHHLHQTPLFFPPQGCLHLLICLSSSLFDFPHVWFVGPVFNMGGLWSLSNFCQHLLERTHAAERPGAGASGSCVWSLAFSHLFQGSPCCSWLSSRPTWAHSFSEPFSSPWPTASSGLALNASH